MLLVKVDDVTSCLLVNTALFYAELQAAKTMPILSSALALSDIQFNFIHIAQITTEVMSGLSPCRAVQNCMNKHLASVARNVLL